MLAMHFDTGKTTLCGKPNTVKFSVPADSPLSFVADHFRTWHKTPCRKCVGQLAERDWYRLWREWVAAKNV